MPFEPHLRFLEAHHDSNLWLDPQVYREEPLLLIEAG